MKDKLYYIIIKIARIIFKLYWKIFKPLTLGVRAIVVDSKGYILLVKHRDDHHWYLPGGQVHSKETLLEALERELKEEAGLSFDNLTRTRISGCYSSFKEGKSDHIVVYIVENSSLAKSTSIEIDECHFFPPHSLPDKISPATYRRVKEYIEGKEAGAQYW